MLKRNLIKWHNAIGWWALAGVIIWSLSAITHPVMSWFGPQSVKFYPPKLTLHHESVETLLKIDMKPEIVRGAKIIKVVPGRDGAYLQITKSESLAREYYELDSLKKLDGQDAVQALWLAGYYTGIDKALVTEVELKTEFTSDYPSVNRLLPVYRVAYRDEQNTVAYIYTETGVLASLSNNFKKNTQWVFQNLHTFQWLNGSEFGRVIIIALWMLTLLATAILGFALVLAFKARKISDPKRRYHRYLAYILWLPLFAWSASGFYHLLHASQVEPVSGLRLGERFPEDMTLSLDESFQELIGLLDVNEMALVIGDAEQVFWRVSIAPKPSGDVPDRIGRFSGKVVEAQAIYIPAGERFLGSRMNDKQFSTLLAERFLAGRQVSTSAATLVTRFGPSYDFRNKRLPVWKVELGDSDKTWLFVDPRTGVLVDKSRFTDRAERWSFSNFHKWNFLTPVAGRMKRDGLIVMTLALLVFLSALGAFLLVKRKRKGIVKVSVKVDKGVLLPE